MYFLFPFCFLFFLILAVFPIRTHHILNLTDSSSESSYISWTQLGGKIKEQWKFDTFLNDLKIICKVQTFQLESALVAMETHLCYIAINVTLV